MAISSFCRSCGDHFRIQKGVAVAKPGLRVSGITPVNETQDDDNVPDSQVNDAEDKASDTGVEPSVDAWLRSARGGEAHAKTLTKQDQADDEEETIGGAISAAGFFGLPVDDEADEERNTALLPGHGPDGDDEEDLEDDNDSGLGRESQSKETLAEGSMGALIGKLADEVEKKSFGQDKSKMPPNYVPPDKRGRSVADDQGSRSVRCFRCNHFQNVTRYATSTQCGRCSVYISLANYEIKSEKSQVLRTRGDVVISRKGSIKNSELACRDLTAYGRVDGVLDCSGLVVFKNSGRIKGSVNCKKLIIEKKCDVEFEDGLYTGCVEVHGSLRGNVTCSGEVRVFRSGVIEGNVLASSISIRDGGSIDGEQEIDLDLEINMPLKGGENSSIIE